MSAAIHSCSLVLAHAPDLVQHGSKPTREHAAEEIAPKLRTFEEALGYPPHQAFLGNLRPEELWGIERPWWAHPAEPKREGPFGVFIDEEALYARMEAADQFQLLKLDGREPTDGSLPIYRNGDRAGVMLRAHDLDESLSAAVLLENLACKATGALALEDLLHRTDFPADELQYVIGCGEEAVGDRYQRGGGNLGKAIAEEAGCRNASGSDVKAFCAGPIHALVVAASLVSAGVYEHVAVVAGGSLAKLGMKFAGALRHDVPVLEDVLKPGSGRHGVRQDLADGQTQQLGLGVPQQRTGRRIRPHVAAPADRAGAGKPRRGLHPRRGFLSRRPGRRVGSRRRHHSSPRAAEDGIPRRGSVCRGAER